MRNSNDHPALNWTDPDADGYVEHYVDGEGVRRELRTSRTFPDLNWTDPEAPGFVPHGMRRGIHVELSPLDLADIAAREAEHAAGVPLREAWAAVQHLDGIGVTRTLEDIVAAFEAVNAPLPLPEITRQRLEDKAAARAALRAALAAAEGEG